MQKPGLLLTASALIYFVAAVALLFLPDEILRSSGVAPSPLASPLLQVLGSALFGFAMLNWMQRYSIIGGIYGRPVLVANLAHAASAALLLAHAAVRGPHSPLLLTALGIYGAIAIGFGARLYAAPVAG